MNCNIQKEISQLKPSEINKINEYYRKELEKDLAADLIEAQIVWIKLQVIGMHMAGLDNDKIIEVLGTWRTMYRQNNRLDSKEDQAKFLDEKLEEIFKGSFDFDYYINSLKKV